jgi:exosome complex exonuclease DIS3/RRP44
LIPLSLFSWCLVAQHGKKYPDLVELLARMVSFEKEREKGSWVYPDHLAPADLAAGLASGKLKKGTYKVNRDYFSESTVSSRDMDAPIFIPDLLHSNRAIDGDIVVVELLPRSQWRTPSKRLAPSMDEESLLNTTGAEHGTGADVEGLAADVASSGARPTGKVVGIFKRNWRPYCGSLEVSNKKKGNVLFLSVNKRIPRIRISTSQAEALMDKRILVQVDSWPADSKYPLGHYTKTLGDIGDKDTETQVLLIEHDIPTAAWSQSVLACLPKDEFNIIQDDTRGRSDFRNLQIFSIDPPGCTDIDDALHCRPLPNGNTEYGVHIADVSHYVKANTAIDAEAENRGTSVYLVDKRIDMLPSKLSTNLCSLRANIDRLTFSVLWEVTPEGNIVDTTFHKAVIRSVAAFTYQQAQERMDSESVEPQQSGETQTRPQHDADTIYMTDECGSVVAK